MSEHVRPDQPAARCRIAVLASGVGTNLAALLSHLEVLGARRPADVVAVLSDRASSRALALARDHGIAAEHLPSPADGVALANHLARCSAGLVVLAGYLRLVPSEVTRAYRGRMLNVHPALLPGFGGGGMYGLRVHDAVLAAGARVSGVTVHFVDESYDRGPIIAQYPVPVLATDTAETLARRVLAVEHMLYPRVIAAVAAGRIALTPEREVRWTGTATVEPSTSVQFSLAPAASADAMAGSILRLLG